MAPWLTVNISYHYIHLTATDRAGRTQNRTHIIDSGIYPGGNTPEYAGTRTHKFRIPEYARTRTHKLRIPEYARIRTHKLRIPEYARTRIHKLRILEYARTRTHKLCILELWLRWSRFLSLVFSFKTGVRQCVVYVRVANSSIACAVPGSIHPQSLGCATMLHRQCVCRHPLPCHSLIIYIPPRARCARVPKPRCAACCPLPDNRHPTGERPAATAPARQKTTTPHFHARVPQVHTHNQARAIRSRGRRGAAAEPAGDQWLVIRITGFWWVHSSGAVASLPPPHKSARGARAFGREIYPPKPYRVRPWRLSA